MCGIIGRVGSGDAVDELLTGLENLEYRGYDSTGIAVVGDEDAEVIKREGEIDQLIARVSERDRLAGTVGVGHTRWSTHGPPTDANAHPHTGCAGDVMVVHNGIIENYEELRAELARNGHEFDSETDTEVIPHLVEEYLERGDGIEQAFRRAVDRLSGSYAVAMAHSDDERLFATRNQSPLVLGVDDGARYLASDVPAFLEFTDRVIYLEDGDVAILEDGDHRVLADGREPVDREIEVVNWDAEDAEKGGFDHYMLKEIYEQPTALRQTLRGGAAVDPADFVGDLDVTRFADVDVVQFVACGTSYHAAMYGTQLLASRGIPAQAMLASEYATNPMPAGTDALVVAVTQSGETADTLAAVESAKQAGHRTLAVTNVTGSTATRVCDDRLLIRAGPEIGVAATKTFSSQVVALSLLAERLAELRPDATSPDRRATLDALARLPEQVQSVLDRTRGRQIARQYRDHESFFFIGRGPAYPVALEGALKFKEISYEHAEGFAGGELKHGPLALVTSDTVLFPVFTGGERDEKLLHNVEEARTRGASVIPIAPETADYVEDVADDWLRYPETHPEIAGLLANVQLQLVSYHAADLLDRPIDKPRNLAKSVTVE